MKQKLLTIAIPTYKRNVYLIHNLRSITTEIDRYNLKTEVEILIGNDNVSNEISNIIEKQFADYVIQVIENTENFGLSKNITTLLESVDTEYVLVLSDDDFLNSEALKNIIDELKSHRPDVAYLNYQPIETICDDKDFTTKAAKTLIHPSLKLKENLIFESIDKFLDGFFRLGFYQTRILLSQQSVVILKREIIQRNIRSVKGLSSFSYKKTDYPHSTYLWYKLPEKILILSDISVSITVNNKGWNNDSRDAVEVVNRSFLPLLNSILRKYGVKNRHVRNYIGLSKIYAFCTRIIVHFAYTTGVNDYLNRRI